MAGHVPSGRSPPLAVSLDRRRVAGGHVIGHERSEIRNLEASVYIDNEKGTGSDFFFL